MFNFNLIQIIHIMIIALFKKGKNSKLTDLSLCAHNLTLLYLCAASCNSCTAS